MHLSHRDVDLLSTALFSLYAIASVAALRRRMLQISSRLVGNSWISFNEMAVAAPRSYFTISEPDAPSGRAALFPTLQRLMPTHPAIAAFHRTGSPEPRTFSDMIARQQLERQPLYNEYYRKVGTTDQLVAFLADDPAMLRSISVNRSGGRFSQRDRHILTILRPHLERAHRNAALLDHVAAAAGAIGPVADTGRALLVVAADGRIEFAPEPGPRWLHEAFRVYAIEGTQCPGAILQWFRAQPVALDQSPAPLRVPAAGGTVSLRFVARDQERLTLLIEKITATPGAGEMALTPREREVLGWIARGKSNPEIALILGSRPRTVEKHVENILAKFHVENRASAMLIALERGIVPITQ